MSTLVKAGLGIGTIAGVSGLGYGIYSSANSKPEVSSEKIEAISYATALNGTLLSTNENENQTEWTARLGTLTSAEPNTLVDSLKQVKAKQDPSVTWKDLQKWCKDIIGNTKQEGNEFQNIQRYCTFSIKEKLKNIITEENNNSDNEWAVGHTALKNVPNEELDSELQTAKSQTDATANTSIKTWCNKAFANPYKGEKDQEFKNASKICVKS
ncbi:hypothetical protein A6V39_05225 [Candidatus Mycoplasma haematobovis]|uniref:Uncharacterized protein n=1 Tax=Candidatus Mycoplasma haematobovis TaxID=432608 RepID=A0A1A9QDQ6_9MOLU|nr:hypothetical protein [Candidatus Mycoplasma haematobovis]OAL09830.1 hypothetical protein A6V39_05225 [Candidatus Mycoplasma haematobovis]